MSSVPIGMLKIDNTAGSISTIVLQSHIDIFSACDRYSSVSISDKKRHPLSNSLTLFSRNIHFILALFYKILLDTIEAPNPIPLLLTFITSIFTR